MGVLLIPFIVILFIVIIAYIFSVKKRKRKTAELLGNTSGVDFKKTSSVDNYIWIDEQRKKWVFPTKLPYGKTQYVITTDSKLYDYSDLINYELLEDGNTITKGGVSLGKAAVGGVLFGGVGAIIGGTSGKRVTKPTCRMLSIKMSLNDINNPVMYFNLLNTETRKDSIIYKNAYQTAQRILSFLDYISNAATLNQNNSGTSLDEIKKLKELLDMGAISQEEYNKKKNELLNS